MTTATARNGVLLRYGFDAIRGVLLLIFSSRLASASIVRLRFVPTCICVVLMGKFARKKESDDYTVRYANNEMTINTSATTPIVVAVESTAPLSLLVV